MCGCEAGRGIPPKAEVKRTQGDEGRVLPDLVRRLEDIDREDPSDDDREGDRLKRRFEVEARVNPVGSSRLSKEQLHNAGAEHRRPNTPRRAQMGESGRGARCAASPRAWGEGGGEEG